MRHFQWPRTVRFSRRAIVAWVVTGFFLPLSYLTWHILGWPADIRMAHDTTRLTSPLTDDGYIDFIRVIREDAQQATKVKDDPWFILFENERLQGRSPPHGVQRATSQWDQIVYRDPVAAFTNSLGEADKSIEGYQRIHDFENVTIPARQQMPFTKTDDALLAEVIEGNADWYEAIQKSYSPSPLPVEFPGGTKPRPQRTAGMIRLDIHGDCSRMSKRFQLRSMLRAGEGDLVGALEDLGFTFNVATRLDQPPSFIIATMVATVIEKNACNSAIKQVLLAKELPPQVCEQLEQFPQGSTFSKLAAQLDTIERYVQLDVIQGMHAGKCGEMDGIAFTGPDAYLKSRRLWHAIDWNLAMRHQNEFFDTLIAAIDKPTWREQSAAIEAMRQNSAFIPRYFERSINDVPLWSNEDLTPHLEDHLLANRHFKSNDFVESIHLRDLRRRVIQIVARLAMWRQIHSRFPDRLQSVQSVPGFSVASSALLIDPFSGEELVYTATNEGFALSTVGPNMQKEEGGVEECSIHEVDNRETRHPDDHIWRWPPVEKLEERNREPGKSANAGTSVGESHSVK